MNARLMGIAGPWKGGTFPLRDDEISIGREPSNQLWITDPALSRRQCVLVRRGEDFIIRDLGSRNGTLVNGMPVQEQQLSHGDQICIGESVLVLLLDENPQLERNLVEFMDTAELKGASVLLRKEDALYLQPDRVETSLPLTSRMASDLNALLKIATGIGGIRDRDSLQWQLLGLVFEIVPAERGAFMLFDHLQEFSSAVAWDRVLGPGHPVRVSRTVVDRVLQEGVGLVVSDVSSEDSLRDARTLTDLRVRSLLCVPLTISGTVVGAIYLDSKNPAQRFDENHLQVMAAVAGIASLALDNVRHWEQLRQENQDLRAEIDLEHNMVGGSSRMREVFEFIRRVAPTDSTVFIHGESGTGKELVARAIHRNSSRAERPFVAINCAAITETLLESELFGHEKGSFTGAIKQTLGKVELANEGTLFLDEIGDVPMLLQVKLLRFLQERVIERIGGRRPIPVDVRIVCATNQNLPEMIKDGRYRGDLFYRLNEFVIEIPPLRSRTGDALVLAHYFLNSFSAQYRSQVRGFTQEARAAIAHHGWPGNVREMQSRVKRAVLMAENDLITAGELDLGNGNGNGNGNGIHGGEVEEEFSNGTATLREVRQHAERAAVEQALAQVDGNVLQAAKLLGVSRPTLYGLIRNFRIKV